MALADDMKFESVNWDIELLNYKHYFPDDIFRLRLGWRKHFSYTDYWQCISMPEDIDVCTMKWRDLVGDIKVSYGLSKIRIVFINLFRRLFYLEYGGGGFLRRMSQKVMFSFRWLIYILFNYKTY